MIDFRKHALPLAVASILLLPLLGILCYPEFNQQAFFYINQQWSIIPDAIWANITFLGDGLWAMGLMSIGVFIAHSKDPLGSRTLAGAAVYGGLLLGVVVQLLKRTFDLDRPSRVFSDIDFNIIGEPLSFHSFPSGHSATIFYMVAIILAYFGIRSVPQLIIAGLLVFAAFIIAISRITTGVHFPADVLTGSLLGWLFGWISMAFLRDKLNSRPIVAAVAVALIGLSAILLLFHDSKLPQTELLTFASGITFVVFSAINLWHLRTNFHR